PDFTMPPEAEHSGQKNSGTSNEKLIAPVDGEIIWGYAVDELIFSRTLSQWMTHSGVDIASPKGTEVYALKGGCIENVYTDDLLGVTVVVAHDDGMMSVYANLKEEPPVSEGQLIESRDLIGFIGDTAISECGDASHLHFELYKGTNTVNPVDYVRFDKTSIE
ncbi:MAG: M23 family metallopeptidase, partial [Clostridia bacterium]|nr:M23 family metallopeptidase [Clostridia bacterium]